MSIDSKKVRVYLPEQTVTEKLDDEHSLVISKQKTDALLSTFSNTDSKTADIVRTIASDDNLRTFFFLQNKLDYQISRTHPVTQSFPFMLTPDYDLFQSLLTDYEEDIKKMRENYDSYKQDFEEMYATIMFEALGLVFTDDKVVRAQKMRKPDDLRIALDQSFESHQDEFVVKWSEFLEGITEHLEDLKTSSEIMEWLAIYSTAQNNSKVLYESGILKGNMKGFFASFNKLSETALKISTKTLCLDCVFKRRDFNFYKSETQNSRYLELGVKCPRCQGNGLIYQLIVSYPVGIHNLILPESNWLPEVIVGYSLSSIEKVDKVYVHKKIHTSRKKDGLTPGVESDIALLTKDKKLILIEVSTTQEIAQLFETAHKKVDFFRKNKVNFDNFGFITADYTYGDYTWMSDKKGVIFKAKHIRDINSFIEKTLIDGKS